MVESTQAMPTSHRMRQGPAPQTSVVFAHEPNALQSSSQREAPTQVNVRPAHPVSGHCMAVGPLVVRMVWFGHTLLSQVGVHVVSHVPASYPQGTLPPVPPPVPTSSELNPDTF